MRGRFDEDELVTYEDGDLVFAEGDTGRELYVVHSGKVVITRRGEGRDVELARLGRGCVFGEMALLETMPRTATAKAEGETRLLVVQPGGFLVKIRRDPTFAFEIMQQLSHRLRVTTERLERALGQQSADERVKSMIIDGGVAT
jgi:CRP-like cAMP-binding protein